MLRQHVAQRAKIPGPRRVIFKQQHIDIQARKEVGGNRLIPALGGSKPSRVRFGDHHLMIGQYQAEASWRKQGENIKMPLPYGFAIIDHQTGNQLLIT